MPRIISGEYGGLVIKTPGYDLRPTSDKIKEYIFNVIRDWDSMVVVDLFAGSGSLGFEALSRGASSVDFADRHYDSIQTIQSTLKRLSGYENKNVRCFKSNALTFCKQHPGRYDRILADPPYSLSLPDSFFHSIVTALKTGGLFVLEFSIHQKNRINPELKLMKEKYFGETGVRIYEK
ncbi:MAG TPA: hypothetical protein ENO01_00200 [Candidatus Marinimicrobia bacterium]|nr:hypothetical protein [Candidatus Neomarinimicrobiota bacterium]